MQIRPLTPADAPAYQALRLLALRESPAAFSASHDEEAGRDIAEVAARLVAADGSVRMLGAFEGDVLAGFVGVLHPQRAKLRHAMELAGLYVAPAHRRRGVGRALLHAAIAQARATRGVRQLKLGVNASNAAALALYRAAGFETYGVEPAALAIDGLFHDEALCMLRLRDS
ncbi:GNAT family N-acetyltransferase [Fulvimonas sp. R45]|uniref:GNAT family N-acetyltransferase n=1 Tax=Fulvimonas sp. R45 TaxID=3045937 RepID=UPI00265F7868|nr:GNAT family N-acetyltransferase [Fulvimonas sp. R45]MDO1529633.1 GNAT family N-acetyltransferase [Fulvimonas sp. R45]